MKILKVGVLVQVALVCSANLIISSSGNIHRSAFLTPNDETFKSYFRRPQCSTRLFSSRCVQIRALAVEI